MSSPIDAINAVDPNYPSSPFTLQKKQKLVASGYPLLPDCLALSSPITASDPRTDYSITKPVLTPPRHRTPSSLEGLRIIEAMNFFQELCDSFLEITSLRIETFNEELQTLLTQLRAASEKAKESKAWSILQKIANLMVASFSLVVGISLLGSGGMGTVVGGAMIVSGILSISNMVLSETGAWNWIAGKLADNAEEQRKLATLIPAIVGVLAGSVGILGSVSAYSKFGMPAFQAIIFFAQSAITIFNGTTTIGKGFADARSLYHSADVVKIKSEITIKGKMIDHVTKSLETIFDTLNNDRTSNLKIIEQITKTHQSVSQRV